MTKITPIRGIDPKLYRQAKAAAALEGITIGAWLNNAIAFKVISVLIKTAPGQDNSLPGL